MQDSDDSDTDASLLTQLRADALPISRLKLAEQPTAAPTAAAPKLLQHGSPQPILRTLQPGHDLERELMIETLAPRGLVRRGSGPAAEDVDAAAAGASTGHAAGAAAADGLALPRELRSSSLTQCGDRVDFIAPAENMKQFFKLLHTEGAISLAVHRVGDSLVLEGLEAEPPRRRRAGAEAAAEEGAASSTGAAPGPLQLRRKSLNSRFLCYSMGASGEAEDDQPSAGGVASDADDGGSDDESSDDDEREEWMPPRTPPRGFRRVLRWQLDELSLLLGSDTVVFRSDEQGRSSLDGSNSSAGYHSPGFSVALHDANSAAASMVCLDYWLDCVLSNASEMALCLHTDGVVSGYRVVPASELPSGGGIGAGFSPAAVTACAVSVLRFLRENCTREAGTYWLMRPDGGDELQLFDITDWPLGGEAAGRATAAATGGGDAAAAADGEAGRRPLRPATAPSSAPPTPLAETEAAGKTTLAEAEAAADIASAADAVSEARRPGPFALPVALLCWRIAEQLADQPGEASRRRRLLESCVSLLDAGRHRQQMPMAAAAHEALADGWLQEAHALLPLPPAPLDWPRAGGMTDQACAAIAAQRAAARALLKGVTALRCVCRPGAAPARLVRMLAKLSRELRSLAHRYLLVRRPGRAVAALHHAARVHAASHRPAGGVASAAATGVAAAGAAGVGGSEDRSPERGTLLLLLADACLLAARASDAELQEYTAELASALAEQELLLPDWAAAATAAGAPEQPRAPTGLPSSFAADAETNFKLAIGHYLSALKLVPSAALRSARERLRGAYSELGTLYVRSSRFTKACRHYQQGVELFRSTADTRSAAAMCVAFGRALRSRLSCDAPALPSAAAFRLSSGGTPGARDQQPADGAEVGELERCAAAFAQAHELLGDADCDPALWREAEAEHARTLLLHASLLEESPAANTADATAGRGTAASLLGEAAARLASAGELTSAGDAHYRLGALHVRTHLRTTGGASASLREDGLDLARSHFEQALLLLPADTQPADHLLVRLDLVKLHRRLRQPQSVRDACAELRSALRHLLATHDAFAPFSFPLPPVAARPSQLSAAGLPAAPTSMAAGGMPAAIAAAAAAAAADCGQPGGPPTSAPSNASSSGGVGAASQPRALGRTLSAPPAPQDRAGSRACALVASLWPLMEMELHGVLKDLIRLHGEARQASQAKRFKQLLRLSLSQRGLLGTGLLARLAEEWGESLEGPESVV